VIWVASSAGGDTELDAMLEAAAPRISHIIKTSYVAGGQNQPPGNLLVIGANLADRLNFADELMRPRRCSIVVQGTSVRVAPAAMHPARAAEARI
jgi:hypothetical protein